MKRQFLVTIETDLNTPLAQQAVRDALERQRIDVKAVRPQKAEPAKQPAKK